VPFAIKLVLPKLVFIVIGSIISLAVDVFE